MTCRLLAAVCAAIAAMPLNVHAADDVDVANIRAVGGQVLELAQNDNHLSVAFHLSNVELGPEQLQSLVGVKDRLAVLNLRGTKLNNDMAALLEPLTELVRLHLEKTAITDAALLHLAEMKKLEYLNLYGTGITDAGLETLAGLPALKRLYVWGTQVTPAGVQKLKEQRPELVVIGLPEPPAAPVAEQKPAEEKPAEEKPAEEKPAEEKPAEEKPAEEKPAGA